MPISWAISGMEMPGRARTSSRACLERVPLPRGRPRRPVPLPLPPPLAAGPPPPRAPRPRGAPAAPPAARGARAAAPPAARRAGAGAACRGGRRGRRVADAVERGGRRLEAVKFVNERPQLLQPGVDLALLLFQEIGHRPALYTERLTRQSRRRAERNSQFLRTGV